MRNPNVNVDITDVVPLTPPHQLKLMRATTPEIDRQVHRHRETIKRILDGKDRRMLGIVGPCSIHDPKAALEYAARLAKLAKEVEGYLFLVMRTYFAKPRTTKGWKGLYYDPFLTQNGGDIVVGARLVRELTLEITRLGLPIATEVLDQFMIQYIDDLVSWACIGARTVESQLHREIASGLSMPVGMKNTTTGSVTKAIDAVQSASIAHQFTGMTESGKAAQFQSSGNPYAHVVLRGGGGKANYDLQTVARTAASIEQRNAAEGLHLHTSILIDAAHENSAKQARNQPAVIDSIIGMRAGGLEEIVGFMVESNLEGGRQNAAPKVKLSDLTYGVSITDECLAWNETEVVIRKAARDLQKMFAQENRKRA